MDGCNVKKIKKEVEALTTMLDRLETMEDYFLQEKDAVSGKSGETTVFVGYQSEIEMLVNLFNVIEVLVQGVRTKLDDEVGKLSNN